MSELVSEFAYQVEDDDEREEEEGEEQYDIQKSTLQLQIKTVERR